MMESSPVTDADAPAPQPSSPPASGLASIGPEAIIAIIGATMQLFLRSQATVRKDELAWTLNSLAHAIRQVESGLGNGAQPAWARYADLSVQQIEAAASYLHNHDTAAILSDVERLAKERPAILFGAMLGVGMLAGRFLKHTTPTENPSHT